MTRLVTYVASISPESQKEDWRPHSPSKTRPVKKCLENFNVRVVKWGEFISINGNKIQISNSCAMDTTLQILLALHCKRADFRTFINIQAEVCDKDKNIQKAIASLRKGEINEAKTLWMVNVLELSIATVKDPTFHTEFDYGWKGFADWFPTRRRFSCNFASCTPNEKQKFVDEEQSIVTLRPFSVSHMLYWLNNKHKAVGKKCQACGGDVLVEIDLLFDSQFLFYGLGGSKAESSESKLITTQIIKGVKYIVYAYTCIIHAETKNAHFVTKFIVDRMIVVYDGMNDEPRLQSSTTDEIVTGIWLIKVNTPV